ncbi:MAG: hypothetical protein JST54_03095 [Deltaproteobacteria bacterium]|nr:hypothetical protein [Deltaproteobacteria bacterium]
MNTRFTIALTALCFAACSGNNGSSGSSGGTTAAASSGGSTGTNQTGASSGSNGTSTTGTSSTSSTGSSGSSSGSSGTTGVSGQIDSDCGTGHSVCNPGTHCTHITQASVQHYSCACTLAGSAAGDSCTNNTNGLTTCDAYVDDCRAPRDFDYCNDNMPCDTNYVCTNIIGATFSDGGGVAECEKECTTTDDCPEVLTKCVPGAITHHYPDGGTTTFGACHRNYCGPNTVVSDGGVADAGQYYQPCDAADAGDGFCVARLLSSGGDYGYCYRSGSAASGAVCGNNNADNPFCALGDLCLYTSDPQAPAFCAPACDARSHGALGICPSGLVCTQFGSGSPTSPDPGYCQ